jgi:hypothetical protein
MRKFPKPACLVLGVSLLGACFWTFGKDTAARRGLDPALAWRTANAGDRLLAVARVKRAGLSATSTNGADWQVQKIICGFNGVAHGNGKFVAVGESGAVGVTATGENWRITSVTTNTLCSVLFRDGCFVASGCAPVREFFTSRDGFVWQRHEVAGDGAEARIGKILETWVTVTNGAAEQALTSFANEVRTLCRAPISGK